MEELAALWDEHKHRNAGAFEGMLARWHIRRERNKKAEHIQVVLNVIAYMHEEEAAWVSVANRSSLQLLT
jgi:hypothetical protein